MEGETAYYQESAVQNQHYDQVFPALPEVAGKAGGASSGSSPSWLNSMKIGSSTVTQVFQVPYEERRYDQTDSFGEKESMRICATIMKDTDAQIEMSSSKNGTLSFVVTGKVDAVMDAKRRILASFVTQASKTIQIPKSHHKVILGKAGARLKELEKQTATKITVPSISDQSDMITIHGTRENVEKAVHQINLISEDQAKKALEVITVDKELHPFIFGAHGEALQELQMSTNTRIHIPPASINSKDITITGERPGVEKASQRIRAQVAEMKKYSHVSIEVKKDQHKYVMGPRGCHIAEILQFCGVSVEVPSNESPQDTITLRGPQDKLGLALTTVYEKANSGKNASVYAPSWLHRHIIGKKGANIKMITQDFPKVHIELNDKLDKCTIEGPPDDVDAVQSKLSELVKSLEDQITYAVLTVDPKHFKHIIGKNGSNINKLKEQTGVTISISDNNHQSIIRIEGTKEGVTAAKQELEEKISKMEMEKEKDVIIESKYHKILIGQRGENIKEVRDKFPNVQIVFPPAELQSEIVKLRGPKEDVDKCSKLLMKKVKELIENSYSVQVPAYQQCQKYIIGKGGANIRKLREETSTQIEIMEARNIITITGKKENVEKAEERIMKLQNEQINMITTEVKISPKLYNSLIGPQGKFINSIEEDCGVKITIPEAGSNSDKVQVMGLKDGVEKAKVMLLDYVSERELHSYSAQVRAKPHHHKFLIGKSGAKIKKIRESTGTRILFPNENDDEKEVIIIMGKKEAVEQAKAELEAQIEKIDSVREIEMEIDQKHHKHFVSKRCEVLHQLEEKFSGITISFPRSGVKSTRVTIKGPPDLVDPVREQILEIVKDLEERITIEVEIPQRHHRSIMGAKGSKVQEIEKRYDVKIKIPERSVAGAEEEQGEDQQGLVNGNTNAPKRCDLIKVTGRPENVTLAEQALKNAQPISVEVEVPYEYHGGIIGNKGMTIKDMMEKYDVNIDVPSPDLLQNSIKLTGCAEAIEAAKIGLQDKIKELDEEREDRKLKSFVVTLEVDPEYHPKIIGKRGAVVSKIKEDHGVQITIPKRGESDENIITIVGYEANALAAKKEIEAIVTQLNDRWREEVRIDSRVHSRLIGAKGRSIKRFMDEFGVEIKFPRTSDPDPNLVVISGEEHKVLDAKERLLVLEEEYMDDVINMEQYQMRRNNDSSHQQRSGNSNGSGFVVKGAPWESVAPDVGSVTDFPSFTPSGSVNSSSSSGQQQQSAAAIGAASGGSSGTKWGPRR